MPHVVRRSGKKGCSVFAHQRQNIRVRPAASSVTAASEGVSVLNVQLTWPEFCVLSGVTISPA